MPKITVIYDSESGHTKALAEAVAEGAREGGVEVAVKHVDEARADDILSSDGLIVGSPTYCGVMSWKLKRFFDESVGAAWGKAKGKIGAAFTTSGGLGGGNEATLFSILSALMNYGFLVFGLPDYSGPGVTAHYGAVAVGEPGEAQKKAARMLGRQTAEYVKRMAGPHTTGD
ncbi:flavodoxin/nitric oxide synthase [Spirochaeta thermophila DSM 6578]|uniref:Flavodoxin/nitric oxide synthase n=1 Tax=Winmispira thermophila (strain ATCC 700085 / DSM 6578 / Z-1203) TaxID=869211 RepID=G0GA61_WINT7|nr:flavodoxin family protein [Spirochaeta thermophila]AEJ60897.1 flavodoxin/nitric oxide synthase [Spirochaeta thermophila DSM 6578]